MNKRMILALVLIVIVFAGYGLIKKYISDEDTPTKEPTEEVVQKTSEEKEKDEPKKLVKTPDVEREEKLTPVEDEKQDEEIQVEPEIIKPLYKSKGNITEVTTDLYKLKLSGGVIESVYWEKYSNDKDIPLFTTTDIDELPLELKFKSKTLTEFIRENPFKTNLKEVTLSKNDDPVEVVFFSQNDEGRIEKHLKFYPDDYRIDVDIKVAGKTFENELNKGYSISAGSFTVDKEQDWDLNDIKSLVLIDSDKKEDKLKDKTEKKDYKGVISWVAIDSKYFISAVIPAESQVAEANVSREKKEHIEVSLFSDENPSFIYYLGPKERGRLKDIGHNLDESVQFGWSILSPIAVIFLKALKFFYNITGNYGVGIIILSVLLNVILLPLSLKGFRSSKVMAQLQPQLKELQKKYKDDPQELNKQTFALYKEYGVSPFSGCLPLILQMPIFISLYWMLRNAVELKGAPFMLWIKDLSAEDALFKLPFTIPLIGTDNFNLLPILMLIAMVISQRFTAKAPADSPQAKFMTFMPIIFGFIFYSFPSGLVLYWLINTILNTLEQKYLVKPIEIDNQGGKKK
jgi:YidC/Oxa1 family membrane protein insertase